MFGTYLAMMAPGPWRVEILGDRVRTQVWAPGGGAVATCIQDTPLLPLENAVCPEEVIRSTVAILCRRV